MTSLDYDIFFSTCTVNGIVVKMISPKEALIGCRCVVRYLSHRWRAKRRPEVTSSWTSKTTRARSTDAVSECACVVTSQFHNDMILLIVSIDNFYMH